MVVLRPVLVDVRVLVVPVLGILGMAVLVLVVPGAVSTRSALVVALTVRVGVPVPVVLVLVLGVLARGLAHRRSRKVVDP